MSEMREMITIVDKSKDTYDSGHLKNYLICIKPKLGGEECWDFVQGRYDAYEYIKDKIDDIDFEYSFIVVSSQKIDDRKSIYTFMNYVHDKFFSDDPFDITEYVRGDWDEDDFRRNNNMDPIFYDVKNNVLDMKSVMNGETIITELGGDE